MIKKLDECDVHELRDVCDLYGLEYKKTQNQHSLRAMLMNSTNIDPDNVDVPEREVAEPEVIEDGLKLKVVFPTGEGVDGTGKIKVTINGRRWGIPRDTEVELPIFVLDFIDTAVIDEMYRDDNGEYQTRPRKRFPYTVVR